MTSTVTATATATAVVGLAPPPPGIVPNFDHPESIGYRLIIATAVCLSFSTTVLLLRLYTTRFIVRSVGAEDYFIIAAQILGIAFSASSMVLIKYGFGRHLWDVPSTFLYSPFMKWTVPQAVFYSLSVVCAKASILLFYLRLSPYRRFRAIVYALLAITLVYSLIASFHFLFDCSPMAMIWDLTITSGHCIEYGRIWVFNAVMNSLTDLLMLLLPVFMMSHVRLPWRQKISVTAVLMVGVLVFAVSLIRLNCIVHTDEQNADPLWNAIPNTIWATIESNVSIICACLPHLKPLLRRYAPRQFSAASSTDCDADPHVLPSHDDSLCTSPGVPVPSADHDDNGKELPRPTAQTLDPDLRT